MALGPANRLVLAGRTTPDPGSPAAPHVGGSAVRAGLLNAGGPMSRELSSTDQLTAEFSTDPAARRHSPTPFTRVDPMPPATVLATVVGFSLLLLPATLAGVPAPAPWVRRQAAAGDAELAGGVGTRSADPRGAPDQHEVTPRGRWGWPLAPPPAVLRRFAIGPHRWSPGHRGVDLRAASGAAVHAPAPGTVTIARMIAGRPVLVISHDGGIRTSYEPVTGVVPPGTVVTRGAVVGRLAASAGHCPQGSCLHWGARRGDLYVDPLSLVRRPPIVLLPFRPDG
jgi:hypothetical protein